MKPWYMRNSTPTYIKRKQHQITIFPMDFNILNKTDRQKKKQTKF